MDGSEKDKKGLEEKDLQEHESEQEALPAPTLEEKLSDELKETTDRLLRLGAEFENFKKISARESANSIKFANENLINSFLPVLDHLEQAVAAGRSLDQDAAKNLLIGVDMVLKQMIEVLQKFGVEFFSAKGKPFDPKLHEAMGEQSDDTVEPGTVITEYQRGVLLHGRLLRPARVLVAKKAE